MKAKYIVIRVTDEDYNLIRKAAEKLEQGNVSHLARKILLQYVHNINLP